MRSLCKQSKKVIRKHFKKLLVSALQKYIHMLCSRANLSVKRPLKLKKGGNGRFGGIATPIKNEHEEIGSGNLAKIKLL